MTVHGAASAEFTEAQYRLWQQDPQSVAEDWRAFFAGFDLGLARSAEASDGGGGSQELQRRADALLQRHRDLGHLLACLDPLSVCPTSHPLLDLAAFGLEERDSNRTIAAPELFPEGTGTLADAVSILRETYCHSVGVEYTHLQDPAEREWLRGRMEGSRNRLDLNADAKRRVLVLLARATLFEEFLQKRYLGQTRFSLEGAEVILPLLEDLVRTASGHGVDQAVLGMAHRGRLNVHVHLLGKTYHEVFCQFEASYDPKALPGSGDVKYHSGYEGDVTVDGAGAVRVLMPENPSHLEAVNPVVEGIARALQDRTGADGRRRVLPILIHGDAAFPGQGIVSETLNFANVEGYSTGGTLHIVLNNQIGYTTLPENARSTRYATDVAKQLMVPIFHVHGEDPEAVLHVARLALEYRTEFGKDAVLDVICYRRHGHNEGDEPYFTQPLMYQRIREREPLYRLFGRELTGHGVLPEAELQQLEEQITQALDRAYTEAKEKACEWHPPKPWNGWGEFGGADHGSSPTGVPEERLGEILAAITGAPEGFHLHPKLQRILERRAQQVAEGKGLDWAGAEALALGSLLSEGYAVRFTGEDTRRGTFSQRHAAWFDTESGETYTPLANLTPDQAPFRIFDSPLSEAATVGFEYGYAAVSPHSLVAWEAQYGDFANGAQVIVDQFLASAEAKWQRSNGVVLLLPHGYEGQGPDHSTSRVERYLQLCARDNLQVCQPTTPAQYFHLLRRQLKQPFRKPLVVLTPKSLLRHPLVVSGLGELTEGEFQTLLPDPDLGVQAPGRVLLCSGKVYYDLLQARRSAGVDDVAILRLEQFYPFPGAALAEFATLWGSGPEWCWVQEEPRNMGGWTFVATRLEETLGRPAVYVGRAEAASPATGFSFIHRAEQEQLVAEALGTSATPDTMEVPSQRSR